MSLNRLHPATRASSGNPDQLSLGDNGYLPRINKLERDASRALQKTADPYQITDELRAKIEDLQRAREKKSRSEITALHRRIKDLEVQTTYTERRVGECEEALRNRAKHGGSYLSEEACNFYLKLKKARITPESIKEMYKKFREDESKRLFDKQFKDLLDCLKDIVQKRQPVNLFRDFDKIFILKNLNLISKSIFNQIKPSENKLKGLSTDQFLRRTTVKNIIQDFCLLINGGELINLDSIHKDYFRKPSGEENPFSPESFYRIDGENKDNHKKQIVKNSPIFFAYLLMEYWSGSIDDNQCLALIKSAFSYAYDLNRS